MLTWAESFPELFWSLVVHLSVCLSVHISGNFPHFHLLLQNHWVNFNQTWHKNILGWWGLKFVQMKGYRLFQGRYLRNSETTMIKFSSDPVSVKLAKIHWRNLKIFFSRPDMPISITLDTKLLMDVIFVCSNEGPNPKSENTLNTDNGAKYVQYLRNLV